MSSSKVRKVVNMKTLKELRIVLCPTGKGSEGARAFLKSNYNILKKQVPGMPVRVRECHVAEPMIFARYQNGTEHKISLKDMKQPAIIEKIKEILLKKDK